MAIKVDVLGSLCKVLNGLIHHLDEDAETAEKAMVMVMGLIPLYPSGQIGDMCKELAAILKHRFTAGVTHKVSDRHVIALWTLCTEIILATQQSCGLGFMIEVLQDEYDAAEMIEVKCRFIAMLVRVGDMNPIYVDILLTSIEQVPNNKEIAKYCRYVAREMNGKTNVSDLMNVQPCLAKKRVLPQSKKPRRSARIQSESGNASGDDGDE